MGEQTGRGDGTGAEPGDEIGRRGSLVLQTLPILLIPLGVGLLSLVLLRLFAAPPAAVESAPNPALPILVLVVFLSALILLVRLRRPTVSALILIGTWTLFTTFASLRNGITSNVVALLIVPICVAGLLIDGVASVSLAALATVLVVSLAWLESSGFALDHPVPPLPVDANPTIAAVFWVGLFWTIAALTSLLSRGLYTALRESRRRAAELRRLSDELEARVTAQTAQLLAQAQERAVLEERTRLAREIHDTLAQGLAGVAVQIGAARQGLTLLRDDGQPGLLTSLGEHLGIAEGLTRETLAEARRSVWNLRAPLLERGGLRDALETIAAQSALAVRVVVSGDPWPLAPAVEAALLRVAQEGLANAAKHAGATQVAIDLSYGPEAVELQVGDDGRGFATELLSRRPAPGPAGGFGLLGIDERLAALGGSVELRNDAGARVIARVPRAPYIP